MVSSISPAYNLTIGNSASAPYTLKVMTIVALIFTPIVLVYQGWSYWVFRARVRRPSEVIRTAPSRRRADLTGQSRRPADRLDTAPVGRGRASADRRPPAGRRAGRPPPVDRARATRQYLVAAVAVGCRHDRCAWWPRPSLLGVDRPGVLIGHAHLGRAVPAAGRPRRGLRSPGRPVRGSGEVAAHRTSAEVTSTLRRQLLDQGRVPRALLAGRRAHRRAGRIGHPGRRRPRRSTSPATCPPRSSAPRPGRPPRLRRCGATGARSSSWPSRCSSSPCSWSSSASRPNGTPTAQWTRLSGLAATFYDLLQGLPTLRAFGRHDAGRRTLERADRGLPRRRP